MTSSQIEAFSQAGPEETQEAPVGSADVPWQRVRKESECGHLLIKSLSSFTLVPGYGFRESPFPPKNAKVAFSNTNQEKSELVVGGGGLPGQETYTERPCRSA